jgi:hypothetical protein
MHKSVDKWSIIVGCIVRTYSPSFLPLWAVENRSGLKILSSFYPKIIRNYDLMLAQDVNLWVSCTQDGGVFLTWGLFQLLRVPMEATHNAWIRRNRPMTRCFQADSPTSAQLLRCTCNLQIHFPISNINARKKLNIWAHAWFQGGSVCSPQIWLNVNIFKRKIQRTQNF